MKLSALPTLAEMQAQPHDLQKRASKLEDREAARKENSRKEVAFRKAVWQRDGGRCQYCGVRVIRSIELVPNRGEVHHTKPRSTNPALKFDPQWARLACAACHGKLTRKEMPDQPQVRGEPRC